MILGLYRDQQLLENKNLHETLWSRYEREERLLYSTTSSKQL
jgi:hypothetical protein